MNTDRRTFLSILGFTGAGCLLSKANGWLENIVSREDELATHVWNQLTGGSKYPQHMVPYMFARPEQNTAPDRVRGFVRMVPIARSDILNAVRQIEADPAFICWVRNGDHMGISSFFYGPAHAFDEESRKRGILHDMVEEQTINRLIIRPAGMKTLRYPIDIPGTTLAERITYARLAACAAAWTQDGWMITRNIVGVRPMDGPSGQVYYLRNL